MASDPKDLPTDWWTVEEVATYLEISGSTVRAYVARDQMPAPDRRMGRMQLWRPKTIRSWHEHRPRKSPRPRSGTTDQARSKR